MNWKSTVVAYEVILPNTYMWEKSVAIPCTFVFHTELLIIINLEAERFYTNFLYINNTARDHFKSKNNFTVLQL